MIQPIRDVIKPHKQNSFFFVFKQPPGGCSKIFEIVFSLTKQKEKCYENKPNKNQKFLKKKEKPVYNCCLISAENI
jgi:hypothetical protein